MQVQLPFYVLCSEKLNYNTLLEFGGSLSFGLAEFRQLHDPPWERFAIASSITISSVYPVGIASYEDAKKKAFTEISVHVFAENFGAVALYEKSGFKAVGREPFVEHPLVRYTGEVFLMTASL